MQNYRSLKERAGFDVVMGNPPYITFGGKEDMEIDRQELEYFRVRFKSSEYKPNSFCMFYEQFALWNCIGGFISFIVPRTFIGSSALNRGQGADLARK